MQIELTWDRLPKWETLEMVICNSAQQADYLMEQFASKGLPLKGCGITGIGDLNAALAIRAY